MKKITLMVALLGSFYFSNAQVGIGTPEPKNSSMLDVHATNKGILIPRVELTSTTVFAPITGTEVESLLVYNTATAGDVTPGFYYWFNNKWERIVNQTQLDEATGKYAYMLEGIGAPFDRIEIRSGNLVTLELLSTNLRIYDVSLLPYFAFDSSDETTTLCTSAPFEIEKMDSCTSYEISYAYPSIDTNGRITSWNDIFGSEVLLSNENEDRVQYRLQMKELLRAYNEAGTLYMKVITTRQGCLYGDAQYLKVKIAACGSIVNPMIRTRLKGK